MLLFMYKLQLKISVKLADTTSGRVAVVYNAEADLDILSGRGLVLPTSVGKGV